MLHFISPYIFLLLFLVGLVAGTVDAIAGGGGLISLPVLLAIGLPPQIALGTNKLQSAIGTYMAARSYRRAGLFSFEKVGSGLVFSCLGTAAGSVAVQIISSDFLKQAIPFLLTGVFLYTFFTPTLGLKDRAPIFNEKYFFIIFGFILGFYDGFFGPGTGSFWYIAIVLLLGFNAQKATAYTKIFNLNSNVIAVICFAIGGNIDYRLALCMALGQLIGGRFGASLAIKNGAKLIRPVFLSVVLCTIVSLFYKNYIAFHDFSHLLLTLR